MALIDKTVAILAFISLLMSCASSTPRAGDDEKKWTDASAIRRHFWQEIVEPTFRDDAPTLTNSGRASIDRFIYHGAENLQGSGFTESELRIAEENLRSFLERARLNAQRQRSEGPVVDESTVIQAQIDLCPLYPFC